MDLDALEPIIEEIVKEALNDKVYIYGRYQTGKTNRVASGTLKNSVKAVVKPNKQGIQIIQLQSKGQPLINTYAYWLVNDRGPGNVAKGVIEKWIKDKKSFKIKNFKTGEQLPKNEKNIKAVAFLIRRMMKSFGYYNKPKNFWEVSLDKMKKDPRIIEIIKESTFDELLNLIEGI